MADGTETETNETQTQQNTQRTDTSANGKDTQNQQADFTADLDQDTREWIEKRGFKSPAEIAKAAREQSKLLGNAVRVPGENATPEERDEFLNKLGRPKAGDIGPEGYDFSPPEDMPEELPYDGERAKGFAQLAHKQGLNKSQAKAIHDWAVQNAVGDFKGASTQRAEQMASTAKVETEKLVKLWGPLEGETMKTNLAFADKALREAGGDDALREFQRVGLIGDVGGVITSAPIAAMLAKVGQTLYKEDDVLKGRVDRLNNPFSEGKDFNVTAQMRLLRQDPDQALAFIAAAGKKPEDFGIKPKA